MTDRGRLHTLSEGDSAQDVLDLARETGHSRFPVIGDDSDDILGLVSLRRAVAVPPIVAPKSPSSRRLS